MEKTNNIMPQTVSKPVARLHPIFTRRNNLFIMNLQLQTDMTALERLYQRRLALVNLIQALEDYREVANTGNGIGSGLALVMTWRTGRRPKGVVLRIITSGRGPRFEPHHRQTRS